MEKFTSVKPRTVIVYEWDCPFCKAVNAIDFLRSEAEVVCVECGNSTYVESTTEADPLPLSE